MVRPNADQRLTQRLLVTGPIGTVTKSVAGCRRLCQRGSMLRHIAAPEFPARGFAAHEVYSLSSIAVSAANDSYQCSMTTTHCHRQDDVDTGPPPGMTGAFIGPAR